MRLGRARERDVAAAELARSSALARDAVWLPVGVVLHPAAAAHALPLDDRLGLVTFLGGVLVLTPEEYEAVGRALSADRPTPR